MAEKFKLLSLLLLIGACLGPSKAQSTMESPSTDLTAVTTMAGVSPESTTTEDNTSITGNSSAGPTTALVNTATTLEPTVSTSVKPTGPCDTNPCGQGSTCEVRAGDTFVCLCLTGENYNVDSKSCQNAKVFPGDLVLGTTYVDAMANTGTAEFKETAKNITDALDNVFSSNKEYSDSIVLKISKVGLRSGGKVNASVQIIFKTSSSITAKDVTEQVRKSEDPLLKEATFTQKDLCTNSPCDGDTTTCKDNDGFFECACKENYIKTTFSHRICIACPSGQQGKDSSSCVNCPFGYSGLNCNESWQLVLVIVGSVLGGLLLIAIILLPVLALKSSKKSSKKDKSADLGKSYASPPPTKTPLVNSNSNMANSQAPSVNGSAYGGAGSAYGGAGSAYGGAGVPRIPRATTTSNWDSRTNLEMTPSNSRQNLIPMGRNSRPFDNRDSTNPYAQSQPQSSLYAQPRPQNNPYAQNRAQVNPYAQSQGQTNPYFTNDNGRRLN